MTTTKTAHSAGTTNDVVSNDAVLDTANERAKGILATSRYEAFRLVTDARTEAETIIEEARSEAAGIVKAAEMTATSKIEDAETHATEIIEAAERQASQPTTTLPPSDSGTGSLEAEHRQLSERVSSLRVLADQLERRFAALAATSSNGGEPADAPRAQRVTTLDYSPSVPPPSSDAEPSIEPPPVEEAPERGSFYSRRSANLPRIGEAGGKSALEMTRSIRRRLEND